MTEQASFQDKRVHAAFKLADIARQPIGQQIEHRAGERGFVLAGLFHKDAAARFGVGFLDAGQKTGTEAGHKLGVHVAEFARRERACQDHAAPPALQGFDGRQHFILHFFLALEKVHVFQQQEIHIPEAALESLHFPCPQGLHEAGGKFFGGQVFHAGVGAIARLAQGVPHSLRQMRFAKPRTGTQKEHVHSRSGAGHVAGRGIGHVVGGTHDKAFKGVAPGHRLDLGRGKRCGDRQGQLFPA